MNIQIPYRPRASPMMPGTIDSMNQKRMGRLRKKGSYFIVNEEDTGSMALKYRRVINPLLKCINLEKQHDF